MLQDECLIRLVYRPGAKTGGEPPRCRDKFGIRRIQKGVAARAEFRPVRTHLDVSVSPTGIEDKDAFRIGTTKYSRLLGTVRERYFARNIRPDSSKLLFKRFLLCGCLIADEECAPRGAHKNAVHRFPPSLSVFDVQGKLVIEFNAARRLQQSSREGAFTFSPFITPLAAHNDGLAFELHCVAFGCSLSGRFDPNH
jgi:hypothetical protein